MKAIQEKAHALLPKIIEWRRTLHACPEIQMQTVETCGHIVRILKEIGITEIRTGIGGNGIAAVIRGGKPGKTLGIRADCDGLPYPEETGLPFASKNGNCHACGHDAHSAMALGAAALLFEARADLAGNAVFIFQPYEEGSKGALLMIKDNVMTDPLKIDAVIGMHTGSLFEGFGPGEVGYRPGVINSNSDRLRVTLHGRAGHGSAPHLTIDPIVMASYAITQLQAVCSREKDTFEPGVISVTRIASGNTHNAIPDSCELEGTIRSFSPETQKLLHERTKTVFNGIAETMRGRADVSIAYTGRAMDNDPGLTATLKETAENMVGADMARLIKNPGTWGEDMAEYFAYAPGVYFFHCSTFDDAAKNFPHHHPKFTVNEDTLWSGSAIFAGFALSWQKG